MNAVELSGQFLVAIKMNTNVADVVKSIGALTDAELISDLRTQDDRLAFWLNLYNGFFQDKVRQDPTLFSRKVKLFFGRHFKVAGRYMSLDEMEHDMLRKTTYKWSFGYIQKPFPSGFKKQFRAFQLDPRVHFAMNCGAKSCPPIRYYDTEHVQEQLETATRSFLEQETWFDKDSNTAHITSLFNWFRGDFGGMKGIKTFLSKYDLIPSTEVKVKFTKYNWEAQFENYAE